MEIADLIKDYVYPVITAGVALLFNDFRSKQAEKKTLARTKIDALERETSVLVESCNKYYTSNQETESLAIKMSCDRLACLSALISEIIPEASSADAMKFCTSIFVHATNGCFDKKERTPLDYNDPKLKEIRKACDDLLKYFEKVFSDKYTKTYW